MIENITTIVNNIFLDCRSNNMHQCQEIYILEIYEIFSVHNTIYFIFYKHRRNLEEKPW